MASSSSPELSDRLLSEEEVDGDDIISTANVMTPGGQKQKLTTALYKEPKVIQDPKSLEELRGRRRSTKVLPIDNVADSKKNRKNRPRSKSPKRLGRATDSNITRVVESTNLLNQRGGSKKVKVGDGQTKLQKVFTRDVCYITGKVNPQDCHIIPHSFTNAIDLQLYLMILCVFTPVDNPSDAKQIQAFNDEKWTWDNLAPMKSDLHRMMDELCAFVFWPTERCMRRLIYICELFWLTWGNESFPERFSSKNILNRWTDKNVAPPKRGKDGKVEREIWTFSRDVKLKPDSKDPKVKVKKTEPVPMFEYRPTFCEEDCFAVPMALYDENGDKIPVQVIPKETGAEELPIKFEPEIPEIHLPIHPLFAILYFWAHLRYHNQDTEEWHGWAKSCFFDAGNYFLNLMECDSLAHFEEQHKLSSQEEQHNLSSQEEKHNLSSQEEQHKLSSQSSKGYSRPTEWLGYTLDDVRRDAAELMKKREETQSTSVSGPPTRNFRDARPLEGRDKVTVDVPMEGVESSPSESPSSSIFDDQRRFSTPQTTPIPSSIRSPSEILTAEIYQPDGAKDNPSSSAQDGSDQPVNDTDNPSSNAQDGSDQPVNDIDNPSSNAQDRSRGSSKGEAKKKDGKKGGKKGGKCLLSQLKKPSERDEDEDEGDVTGRGSSILSFNFARKGEGRSSSASGDNKSTMHNDFDFTTYYFDEQGRYPIPQVKPFFCEYCLVDHLWVWSLFGVCESLAMSKEQYATILKEAGVTIEDVLDPKYTTTSKPSSSNAEKEEALDAALNRFADMHLDDFETKIDNSKSVDEVVDIYKAIYKEQVRLITKRVKEIVKDFLDGGKCMPKLAQDLRTNFGTSQTSKEIEATEDKLEYMRDIFIEQVADYETLLKSLNPNEEIRFRRRAKTTV